MENVKTFKRRSSKLQFDLNLSEIGKRGHSLMKKIIFCFFNLFLLIATTKAGNIEADKLLSQGLNHYNEGRYQQAVDSFKLIIQSPYFSDYYAIGHFMLAKGYLALNNNKKAAEHNEYFLLNYKDHPYYQEAYYLKGLILFRQGDFNNALQVAEDFLARYPTSQFVPSAYFVIGEALYNLGQLDKSLKIYQYIIEKYPSSNRLEACQFRVALIGFKRREQELLRLLKWSYEDSLKVIEDYKLKEATYEQALTAYQKQLAESGSTPTADVKSLEVKLAESSLRIQELEAKIKSLEAELELLRKKITQPDQASSLSTTQLEELAKRQEMLEMKEKALAIKEEYLKWLQNYLENKK